MTRRCSPVGRREARRRSREWLVAGPKHCDAPLASLRHEHGISQPTCHRWKARYGGLEVREAQRLRQLEDENRRLEQLVWTR